MQWIIVFILMVFAAFILYFVANKKKKSLSSANSSSHESQNLSGWLISFASQAGFAEQLAKQTAEMLKTCGLAVTIKPLHKVTADHLLHYQRALFVVSTFGEGEAPDHARAFIKRMQKTENLKNLRFGLLALGDQQYETFCGFGRTLDTWLQKQGAQPLFERIEVDNRNSSAIDHWKTQLSHFGESLQDTQWFLDTELSYERWRLIKRYCINPNSEGNSVFHLEFESATSQDFFWQAGDLVDIKVRYADSFIEEQLKHWQLDGHETVSIASTTQSIRELLATHAYNSEIEDSKTVIQCAQDLVAFLKPLAPRQYSISSITQDQHIHLLVRQTFHHHHLGVGSGWLTQHLPLNGEIELNIRPNRSFQLPVGDYPVIFIGNGTGIAGLRSHLKTRIQAGYKQNWLFFGERQAAHDYFYQNEIQSWHQEGYLQNLNLAFSRDQPNKIYVQDRLREAESLVRDWINQGAFILICGSLEGMAPAIEATLISIIGSQEAFDRFVEEGRYLRDVY